MPKSFKRLYVSGITILLTLSLCLYGCQAKQSKPDSSSSAQEKEPVTLKIVMQSLSFPNGIQDDPIAKEIEKKTGIKLDWVSGGNDWETYQSALLASGDLPDIMMSVVQDNKFKGKIFAADAALPLDDLINKSGQEVLKNAPDMVKLNKLFKAKNNDGKLYFLSTGAEDSGISPSIAQGGAFIRWDLYKSIGMPKVETENDLLNVLKQMQDKFPTAPDGKKAYAISGWFGADWAWQMPERIFEKPMGIIPLGYPYVLYYDMNNMDHVTDAMDPNSVFFHAAKFTNKAYQMGILDPDSFTMKFDQYQEKLKADRVYFGSENWATYDIYNPSAIAKGTPDKGFEPIWFLGNKEQPYWLYEKSPGGQYDWWVPKSSKHSDRVADLFNFLFSYEGNKLLYNGIEGKDYDIVNGVPKFKEDVSKAMKSDPNFTVKTGIGKYYMLAGLAKAAKAPEGIPVDFRTDSSYVIANNTPLDKDYSQAMGLQYPFERYMNEAVSGDLTYQIMVSPADNPDLVDIYNKYNDYMINNYAKLISAKSDAEFDANVKKFIKDTKAMGIDKVADYMRKQFKDIRQKLGQ